MISSEDLLERLNGLGIETQTVEHPAVHTVEDNKAHRGDLPGAHCKNLFLKDKKAQLWMVVLPEDRQVDLKEVKRRIGAAHLSFGKADLLEDVLGVSPGAVTPFAAVNDGDKQVTVILDEALMSAELLNFHPLRNTATTAIAPADLVRFLEAVHQPPRIVQLD